MNLLPEIVPKVFWGGFVWGLAVGLITYAPYATLDHPQISAWRYWVTFGSLFGIGIGITAQYLFLAATPRLPCSMVSAMAAASFLGLWLGLTVGNRANSWIAALEPTFRLLRRMATTLVAFAVGYLAIVILFATFYAAAWRLEGAEAFTRDSISSASANIQ